MGAYLITASTVPKTATLLFMSAANPKHCKILDKILVSLLNMLCPRDSTVFIYLVRDHRSLSGDARNPLVRTQQGLARICGLPHHPGLQVGSDISHPRPSEQSLHALYGMCHPHMWNVPSELCVSLVTGSPGRCHVSIACSIHMRHQ